MRFHPLKQRVSHKWVWSVAPTGRIRIYGEFVDVVLKLGMLDACLELERYAMQVSSENAAHIYSTSRISFPPSG
jgi:hypothetical protein